MKISPLDRQRILRALKYGPRMTRQERAEYLRKLMEQLMEEKQATIKCVGCMEPKAPVLFPPYQVKKAQRGRSATCRLCLDKRRAAERIKVPPGGNWHGSNRLCLPGGFR